LAFALKLDWKGLSSSISARIEAIENDAIKERIAVTNLEPINERRNNLVESDMEAGVSLQQERDVVANVPIDFKAISNIR